ncbi:MAG: ImmA/IrrE family metallo-endopeptidase [Actinomycetota bacterium]|nr:ImmA/IrrE family metallo-endopeptidase [Actinomycetota bacterium]
MLTAERYREPRAHALRERYLAAFGGDEIPVPIEAIAEDLLGLRVEQEWGMEYSGMLLPAERKIVLNAAEAPQDASPLRRFRFTIAHEVGHWVCHVLGAGRASPVFCRAKDISQDADRNLEREANVFAAELLLPEPAVRGAWDELGDVATCAARFDVSPTAMHWRLFNLGAIESQPLWQIGTNGLDRIEG